ncbi:hypothetical protein CTEN210_02174 [Chaetoceros tenuissimus]|uniref:U2 snRNP-associated SURP motif-containing protein n=1 Tax=Chaetoceros tenuissimus TaxID=426638 RepID=A0AAD3CIE9_9STRA|nr:hypothetical protein CTEN210_02174 [Chaetoceros tenuissimus]
MRHRTGPLVQASDDDSSSDDDAFSAFSRKKKQKRKRSIASTNKTTKETTVKSKDAPVVVNDTSSNKRHHHQSTQRAAKMDAFLKELQDTTTPTQQHTKSFQNLPDKLGSYPLPGEEDTTTNIFVGNLSPLTTEEQLSKLFASFGPLYSVKIMWPRNRDEASRGRLTGFVCFKERSDAQDAMDTLQDTDALSNGRLMYLNWGRSVKMHENVHSSTKSSIQTHDTDESNIAPRAVYDPTIHTNSIKVECPSDMARFRFISTIASFVAKDGSALENKLIEQERYNPAYAFLQTQTTGGNSQVSEETRKEQIFYRWRVFSFSQGDDFYSWRIEPFVMFKRGSFWIPPPLDENLLAQNKMEESKMKEQLEILKQQRRNRRGYNSQHTETATGRQLENRKRQSQDGYSMLTSEQLQEWDNIIDNLTAHRDSICEAMAWCFDHSTASQHLCELLKKILLDNRPGVSVETKCARLFLLSDILFNSQQVGVKNAFHFRDAIEVMAPEVFKSFGEYGNGTAGRITMNKLHGAIRKVLDAWNSWSVYSDVFLDRLEAMFEGKDVSSFDEIEMKEKIIEASDDRIEKQQKVESTPSSIWMEIQKSSEAIPRSDEQSMDGDALLDDEIDPATLIDEELDGESVRESEISDTEFDLTGFDELPDEAEKDHLGIPS